MTGIRSTDSSMIDDRRTGSSAPPQPRMSSRQGSLTYPSNDSLPVNQNRPLRGSRLLSQSQTQQIAPGTSTTDAYAGTEDLVNSYVNQRRAAQTRGYY